MFTGIIESKAKILDIQSGRFTIENIFPGELKLGQSIAHDGACMSLEYFDEKKYSFFVMQESLNKTNFLTKQAGEYFNIERCMRVDDRIDGHFVSGHIDTTANVKHIENVYDGSLIIGIGFDEKFSDLTIIKGSIAINGVSLTIIEKNPGYISVSLIPLTQDWTNLGKIKAGDIVNLEFDMLGKYILNTQNDS